ncbi:quercetin dioxygenase-like cupin family protein [Kribbella pratensis]|uniref:Quercetin dioxygenase-like cupin family protein n=1 Tax=Kribbella pratensis TaxID=2512112 RepID=A0ABY2F7U2_9ACTN|nr:cupin domain-containing protein [Kribbella pratensis]TDW84339.1 quercetin dioxygenase-like cupin family protein [Kribbella pratensis]
MYLTRIGTTPRRRAPVTGGPTMEVLVAAETSDNIAMVQVWIPPGGGLPEHDHGSSEVVLVHISGSIHLQQGGREHRLAPGAVAHIAAGERVSLTNPGTETAVMTIVASPPEFVARITAWPAA